MKIYTSEEILQSEDLYDIQDNASMGITIKYQLTKDELQWLDFVRGRYSIADYIDKNMEDDVLSIIVYELSIYLDYDCKDLGKAVCLSDNCALQRLFFWLYREDMEYNK